MATPKGMGDPIPGFIAELVKEVAERANFTPVRVAIDNYPNSWGDGGEDYDMVAADLSVTERRNKNMEFSIPFMRYGLTILMQRTQGKVANIFAILHPFSSSTWLLILLSYLLMSLLLLLTSRLDQTPPSIFACLWLPLASLLGGHSTNWLPSSPAPRLLLTGWWLFIIFSSSLFFFIPPPSAFSQASGFFRFVLFFLLLPSTSFSQAGGFSSFLPVPPTRLTWLLFSRFQGGLGSRY